MAVSLKGMQEYGYADDSTWQPRIALQCLNAAKEYFANGGANERESDLYDQGVYMLAMHWYDNRETEIIGHLRGELLYGVSSIIHQLANTPQGLAKGYTPVTLEGDA